MKNILLTERIIYEFLSIIQMKNNYQPFNTIIFISIDSTICVIHNQQ